MKEEIRDIIQKLDDWESVREMDTALLESLHKEVLAIAAEFLYDEGYATPEFKHYTKYETCVLVIKRMGLMNRPFTPALMVISQMVEKAVHSLIGPSLYSRKNMDSIDGKKVITASSLEEAQDILAQMGQEMSDCSSCSTSEEKKKKKNKDSVPLYV